MPENIFNMLPELWLALGQTLLMLAIGLAAAVCIGGPLGVLLFLAADGQSRRKRRVTLVLGWLVNTVRSFPFIILMVALVPFTRIVAGTSIGPLAAAVPLSFAAIPYFARLVEQQLHDVPRGVIEAAEAMGATRLQIVTRVLLFLAAGGQSRRKRRVTLVLGWLVNTVRSFPFIILMVALVPFTRIVAGTSIGPLAASVPLSFAAIPYFARLVEQNLREVPRGVIEAAQAMGASEFQIVTRVLLVEARAGLVLALTVLAISFLSYSAVAGVVGGGGIGDLAIRYGYYRFETDIMAVTVAILIALVQLIQFTGSRVARRIDHR